MDFYFRPRRGVRNPIKTRKLKKAQAAEAKKDRHRQWLLELEAKLERRVG